MDIPLLAIWIGLTVTFILGLINLLWGPAILKNREKVIITDNDVFADYSPKDKGLELWASCSLVLASGDRGFQVVDVMITFDRKACDNLKGFFNLPRKGRLRLYPENEESNQEWRRASAFLEPGKLISFHRKIFIDESKGAKIEAPRDIQPYLDQIEAKYDICWTRYDGKKVCWKFPNKWRRNLGKKLWG